ncbi:MAG: UDP-N-acetyl glucosamine 2-epimerase [archaeon]|nr:UDP-N-acetyl glucosamine 2-epimerase [archaeon]
MKISIILGTRPEIIKMSPIIRECENQELNYFILHTGQHYSYNLDKIFFEELELPAAKYNLDVGSGTHAEETGKMLIGIEKILNDEKPDIILVEGDTNTVLAGALAAVKLGIKVGHVEAGLRSYDRGMPEEINRVLADHVSDYLFAPTLFLFHKKKTCAKRKNCRFFGKAFFLKERFVLTDSGGVQEETCILKVPCVTLRDNTERPETLEVGSNILAGVNQDKILEGVKIMLSKERNWRNLFGDGKAGERIAEILI